MDTNTYEVILRDGVLFYHYADGTVLPLIAGAAEGEGAGAGAGGGGGDGSGGGGGAGDGQGSGDGDKGDKGGGAGDGDKGAGAGGGAGDGDKGGDGGKAGLTLEQATAELERVRKEAATHRVGKNEANKKVEELSKQIDAIKKSLGLAGDEQDPEKLQAQIKRVQDELRQERMRNAFHRVAGKLNADIELTWAYLFASGDLSNIEGDGDELDRAIEERVKTAIAANPKLKASQLPGKGGGDFGNNGGGGGDGKADMNKILRRAAGRQ